jgi:hypothetical protein
MAKKLMKKFQVITSLLLLTIVLTAPNILSRFMGVANKRDFDWVTGFIEHFYTITYIHDKLK